jgi:hypothetical protein
MLRTFYYFKAHCHQGITGKLKIERNEFYGWEITVSLNKNASPDFEVFSSRSSFSSCNRLLVVLASVPDVLACHKVLVPRVKRSFFGGLTVRLSISIARIRLVYAVPSACRVAFAGI